MKRYLMLIVPLALVALGARAQTPGPAAPVPTPATAPRDPFNPVGWVRPKPETNVVVVAEPEAPPPSEVVIEEQWEDAITRVHVDGVGRRKGAAYAILKGIGIVRAGDTFSLEHEGLIYHWKVKSVTKHGITPQRLKAIPREKAAQGQDNVLN